VSVRVLAALAAAFLLGACGGSEDSEPKAEGTASGFTTYTVESSGFSIAVPESWQTASGEKALNPADIERVTKANPNLRRFFEGLADPTSPFKLVSVDPEEESGFATNMNVVVTDLPEDLGIEEVEQAALKEVQALNPRGEVEHAVVEHPAGEAIRFEYEAEVQAGSRALLLAFIQYSVVGNGNVHTLTFTTLPRLSAQYRDSFERSADSFRLLD
jgi:hypothetical protein